MALQARSQNRRVLLGSQPIPAATRQSLGTSQRGFFVHLPPNSLDYRDRYGLQQVRYVKAIVPIGLGKQSGILCVVQPFWAKDCCTGRDLNPRSLWKSLTSVQCSHGATAPCPGEWSIHQLTNFQGCLKGSENILFRSEEICHQNYHPRLFDWGSFHPQTWKNTR